jgi:hypothetical protein
MTDEEDTYYADQIEDPQARRVPAPSCEGKHFCTVCEGFWRHSDLECRARAVAPCPAHENV